MRRFVLFLLFCSCVVGMRGGLFAIAADSRPAITWEKSELGETAFVPMKSAPYPHPSRDNGYRYGKIIFPRDPHYSDSTVGLFIPRGYRRTPKTNVLVYLHGWNNHVRKAIAEYKLREQIVASGQNII
ncbi:MAG TPA: hypothetical protein VHE81_05180, partial [Lacipirellulaceae bacterium]|nr:hypothetical protein [Lacipirellulaceae bacterium]